MYQLRKAERRKLQLPIQLQDIDGGELATANLIDISDSGAKLQLESAMVVPASFVLVLSPSGIVRRMCELAWQAEQLVGVRFMRGEPAAESRKACAAAAYIQAPLKKKRDAD